MEDMRQIATAYYERSSDEEKKLAEAFFQKLDADGNREVTLAELRKSLPCRISNENVFRQLDENGDGILDFGEVLAVYYIVHKVELMVCAGCYTLLSGPYFSCRLCLGKGSDDTFNLCCGCYRSGKVEHEHPTCHLLDHHSLLGELRKRGAEAQNSPRKREMEELREIAKAHHRAGSREVQSAAYDFFKSMDTDGDDRVDLSEFLDFMTEVGYPAQIDSYRFFSDLDHDGNGSLDFWEVMTLYYIFKSGRPFCNACRQFIPGIFFSCVECFTPPETAFNLCRACYRSDKCIHSHDGGTQFLDNYTLLEATRNARLAQATGVSSPHERSPLPSNDIVPSAAPVQHTNIYMQKRSPIQSNDIVPSADPVQHTNIYMHSAYPYPSAAPVQHTNTYMHSAYPYPYNGYAVAPLPATSNHSIVVATTPNRWRKPRLHCRHWRYHSKLGALQPWEGAQFCDELS